MKKPLIDYTKKPKSDEFYTPEYAIKPILAYLKSKSVIWCPFDTEASNFVKVLRQEGHVVIATHIFNGKDFFQINPEDIFEQKIDYIISNPPYWFNTSYFCYCVLPRDLMFAKLNKER